MSDDTSKEAWCEPQEPKEFKKAAEYFKFDVERLSPEQASKLDLLRQDWYLKNRGIDKFLKREFTRVYVDRTFKTVTHQILDGQRRRELRTKVYHVLRSLCVNYYFVHSQNAVDASNRRLNAFIGPLQQSMRNVSLLQRHDLHRLSYEMSRIVTHDRRARYCVVSLGLLGRILERGGISLSMEESDLIRLPAPDEKLQGILYLDEEWHSGLLYLIDFLSDLTTSLVTRRYTTSSHLTELDIVIKAVEQLFRIYSELSNSEIGRPRLARLTNDLVGPLLPREFRPSTETLAKLVLKKLRRDASDVKVPASNPTIPGSTLLP